MANVSWAVDADGNWDTVLDWSPKQIPNSSDAVTINTTDLHTVTHSAGTDTVLSLAVGNDDFVVSGGSLTVTSTASFANLLTISGGTLNLTAINRFPSTAASLNESGGTLHVRAPLTVTGAATFSGTSKQTGGHIIVKGAASVASGASLSLGLNHFLALSGPTTLDGAVTGQGDLLTEGVTTAIDSGAQISVAYWEVENGVATFGESLAYAGSFFQGSATADLGGHTLTLTGRAGFEAATVNDGSALTTNGATTLYQAATTSLTLGAGVTWTNFGTVTQEGTISSDGGVSSAAVVVNQSTGVYDITGDTGVTAQTFVNDGVLEKTGAGGTSKIVATVHNAGTISVAAGTLEFAKAVAGTGAATISNATLQFDASFNENVDFSGISGGLVLARSQTYTKTVSGFALNAETYLDLGDIGFVSAGEATFSGTTTGGTLTVTDGTHTASIKLAGNYLSSTFTASSDGNGGTFVVASPTPASPHRFIAAVAGFVPRPGAVAAMTGAHEWIREPVLAKPQ